MSDDLLSVCRACDGCGKIADSETGEPWTAWSRLPLENAAAVVMGLVRPLPCPSCGGAGTRAATHKERAMAEEPRHGLPPIKDVGGGLQVGAVPLADWFGIGPDDEGEDVYGEPEGF